MDNNYLSDSFSEVRKTKFNFLKEEQCLLNMQIRLAMQLHDAQTQVDLGKKLKDITDQIDRIVG